jgi:hypothetical protein
MTWMCPACQMTIQHAEDPPRSGVVYRCHVCHLELIADAAQGQLRLAPSPGDRQRRTRVMEHYGLEATKTRSFTRKGRRPVAVE